MFCSNCGKELPANARFCNACGRPIEVPIQPPAEEPEPVAVEAPAQVEAPQPVRVEAPAPEPRRATENREEKPADEPLFAPAPEPVVPEENRPLGPWAYFGYGILFSIPVIGFILLIIFSFAGKNVNRKNFARSYWCWFILALAIVLILVVILLTGVLRNVTDAAVPWLNSIGLDWLTRFLP